MTNNETSVIRISHAHKFYNRGRSNEIHVMNDMDVSLPERGMVAIFGKSGCGKTTLLNAVGGLDSIQSGSIRVFGEDMQEHPDTVRNKYIGYIFQNYNLNVGETIYENVADALRLCGVTDAEEIRQRVMASLANVGLDKYKDRTPDTLSGGQQQRVAIARAICKGPAIILADEPTGNLDENNTVMVMDILKELSKNCLVLLVTHEAHLVDFYCDRVIEIVDGRIVGIRENSSANGYVQRNKNDIYLGELTETETTANGVTLKTYSDGGEADEVRLTLVSRGGKLYLRCDTPGVRVLDETSEVKLREGCFEATPAAEAGVRNERVLDMSALSPVEGKHFGRLYHFGNALSMAWRENYSQRKKKGRVFLQVCLILLAVVLVFMTAINAVNIKRYQDAREDTDWNIFFVPVDLTKQADYNTSILEHIGQDGLAFASLTDRQPSYAAGNLMFNPGNFMTASTSDLNASAYPLSISVAKGLNLVCGTNQLTGAYDILITTALGDELIKSSTVSFINGYDDLLGLVSSERYGMNRLRIVGVVESEEKYFFLDDLQCAYTTLSNMGLLALPLSMQSDYDLQLKRGEIAIFYNDVKVGQTVKLFGQTFTVAYVYAEGKADWYGSDTYYEFLLNDEDYKMLMSSVGETDMMFGSHFFYVEEFSNVNYYGCHIMVYASDPDAAEAYLVGQFGDDVVTPSDIFDENIMNLRGNVLGSTVTICVIVGFMCLCVFFIMRSSFMSRVREVGILRAIGVSRKNLLFRFLIETGLLTLLTVGVGYLLASLFIAYLSDAPLFNTVFYFPVWMAVGIAVLLFAVMLVFGLLPAMLLLRKTPSEILAKYDI